MKFKLGQIVKVLVQPKEKEEHTHTYGEIVGFSGTKEEGIVYFISSLGIGTPIPERDIICSYVEKRDRSRDKNKKIETVTEKELTDSDEAGAPFESHSDDYEDPSCSGA